MRYTRPAAVLVILAYFGIFGCSERTASDAKNDTGRSMGDAAQGRGESPAVEPEGITGGEREERIRRLIHSAFRGGGTEKERLDAAWALIDLGGEDVAAALVEAFRTGEPEARREIIDTLSGHFGKHIPAVADFLAELIRASPNADLRAAAADGLRDFPSLDLGPEGAPVRAALRQGLADPAPLVRVRCAIVLLEDGEFDRVLLEALRGALHDDSARIEALDGLSWAALASDPEEASRIALELVEQLASANAEVRRHAMAALRGSGVDTTEVRGACLRGLEDADPEVRREALYVFAEFPDPTEEVLSAIERCLGDDDGNVRRTAIRALGTAGPTAVRTARKVAALAQDSDESTSNRLTAIESLREIRCQDSIPALIRLTEDREYLIRADATIALGSFSEDAAAVVPFVIRRLEDESSRVVLAALGALSRFEDSHTIALPALQKLLVRDNDWGRHISMHARKMIERLAREDPDESVRRAATEALKGGGNP